MTRLISFICAIVFVVVLLVLTFWALLFPEPIDPALWNQYKMTDLRGH